MPVAWYPNRWWDWCISEDEKKEIDSIFIEELLKCVGIIQFGGIRRFWDKKMYMNFLAWFWYTCTKIYTQECLKQFSAYYSSKYL